MNRRPSGSLLLSRAIQGFRQYKSAEGLSPSALRSYQDHLKLWLEHVGDIPFKQIDAHVVQEYFVWLRTEYQSRQIAGRPRPLAPKTIRNFHITLSAFFTWASREFEVASPMKAIPVPKYEEPPVEPFTKEQIEALLKAATALRDEVCRAAEVEQDPVERRRLAALCKTQEQFVKAIARLKWIIEQM